MEVPFGIQDTDLCERVDELIRSYASEQPLLHSTPVHTAIAELICRNQGLEEAVRELAREIQQLTATQETLSVSNN